MNETITRMEAVERVMSSFAFEKMHRYMVDTNWYWCGVGIPSVEQLKAEARRLLELAVQSKHRTHAMSACGGFEARVDAWDDHKPSLSLHFIPISSEVWSLEP